MLLYSDYRIVALVLQKVNILPVGKTPVAPVRNPLKRFKASLLKLNEAIPLGSTNIENRVSTVFNIYPEAKLKSGVF